MRRTRHVLLAAVFASLCGAAHANPTLSGPVIDQLRATKQIVLAHRESSVPFSYVGPDKQAIGYALDVCKRVVLALQTRLGIPQLEVVYRQVTPANRMDVIANGEAHMECGSTTNNADRRKKVAFTVPHFITGARMLVKADSPIDRIDHPDVKRLVSTRNTTPLTALKRINAERYLRLEIVEAEDHEKAVQMVERGEVAAFVMDDVLLYGLASNRADPKALKVTGRFITTEPLAIMLPPNDPAFKKIVDDEMRRLILSREIHPIYDRWFMQPIPPRNLPMNLAMSYLLRDFWKYPTDQVP